ncbi:MAG TPA: hypothetical protein VFH68_21885 [Polyangia bacterium]|jgi:hypothetical protein|nr:hypothetical protein [Polyangia bacterium]
MRNAEGCVWSPPVEQEGLPLGLVVAVALALAACGGPTQQADPAGVDPVDPRSADFQSGTRLKLPFWSSADGVTRWQGTIYDTARGEPCIFQRAADGKRRCLPDTSILQEDLFGDAACTQPLAAGAGGTPEGYARLYLATPACEEGARVELREVGPELGRDPAYALSDAGCVLTTPVSRLVHYRTGRALPPDLFVAADQVVLPATEVPGRLAEVYLRAEDGARIRMGLYDMQEDVPCTAQVTGDGATRCVPAGSYVDNSSGDLGRPDCSGPRIATALACRQGKADLVALDDGACPRHVQLYAPGPAWPGGQTYRQSEQGACVAGPVVTTPSVQIVDALDPARFARLEIRHRGAGRLRDTRYQEAGASTSIAPSRWVYDSLLGEPCAFGTAPDGEIRCVPSLLLTLYRDAACADPVGLDILGGPCDVVPANYVAADGRLHAHGDRLSAPPAELFGIAPETGACQSANVWLSSTFSYYEIGPAISAELVAATSVTYQ